jgi:prepilin-type N-terminal cleavage/methylation domain-containing protein
MTALQAYLQNSKTRKVLSKKPGEAGFSLIELVVVVAVLAILSAIALPVFNSISDKARVSGAKGTLASIVKECGAKLADSSSGTYNSPQMDSYTFSSSGTAGTCATGDTYTATPATGINLPVFVAVPASGAKTCTVASSGTNAALGCTNSKW